MSSSDPGLTRYTIRRIDVLSLAKMLAALHAMIGVVIGTLVSISSLINSDAPQEAVFGPMAFIVLPIINLLLGFIGGALIGVCYNFSARLLGGIKIYLNDDSLVS